MINKDKFLSHINLLVREIFWNVLELNVGLMTIISLVTVFKIDIGERRRFAFIGSIEDLLGLYKALLYDKHGQCFTNIVVEQVKVKFESEEYQMVRDTLLLLFYYFIFFTAIFEE